MLSSLQNVVHFFLCATSYCVRKWGSAKLFYYHWQLDHYIFQVLTNEQSLKMLERINITYRNYILGTILKCAKETKYNKYYVEEVGEDGSPHIAQKIKHLALHC